MVEISDQEYQKLQARLKELENKESEEKFVKAFETSPYAITITRAEDGGFVDVNPAFCRMTGYAKEEALAKTSISLELWNDAADRQSVLADLRAGRPVEGREYRFKMKNGQILIGSYSAQLINLGQGVCIFSSINDITESRRAMGELLQKSALLEAQLNSSNDGILVVDPAGKKVLQNRRTVELWKIPPDVANDPDDSRQVQHVMRMTKDPDSFVKKITDLYGHPTETSQDTIELTDGTILDRYSAPVLGRDGQNYGRIWMFHDITKSQRAEEALRQSHIILAKAVAVSHLGPWEYDVLKDIFTFTDEFYAIFHTTAEQAGGYTMSSAEYAKKFVHPDDVPVVGEAIAKAIAAVDPNLDFRVDHRMIYADGKVGYIVARFWLVKDQNGKTVKTFGVNQDITESKLKEEELSAKIKELEKVMKIMEGREDKIIELKNEIAQLKRKLEGK